MQQKAISKFKALGALIVMVEPKKNIEDDEILK